MDRYSYPWDFDPLPDPDEPFRRLSAEVGQLRQQIYVLRQLSPVYGHKTLDNVLVSLESRVRELYNASHNNTSSHT